MPTQIHLIRHGHHALLGRVLCGRMPGVRLDDQGCQEMARCADAIAGSAPSAVQSSPQMRARQSAAILASRFDLPVEIAAALDEIDIGDWTGRSFDELEHDAGWQLWNRRRGSGCPPGGESMGRLQARILAHLQNIHLEQPGATIAIVSHAEVIRAALLHYLGIPLDEFMSVEVDTASVSTLMMDDGRVDVLRVNNRVLA